MYRSLWPYRQSQCLLPIAIYTSYQQKNLMLKSYKIVFVYTYFSSKYILLIFCTEHGSITAMLCAKFQKDWLTLTDVTDQWVFSMIPISAIVLLQHSECCPHSMPMSSQPDEWQLGIGKARLQVNCLMIEEDMACRLRKHPRWVEK